jgi:hypothetical protein
VNAKTSKAAEGGARRLRLSRLEVHSRIGRARVFYTGRDGSVRGARYETVHSVSKVRLVRWSERWAILLAEYLKARREQRSADFIERWRPPRV